MSKPKEASIESYLEQQAKQNKFFCKKYPSTHLGGMPDRILIGHGHTVFVEVKRPGEKIKPNSQQEWRHIEIARYGGQTFIVSTHEEVDQLLSTLAATSKQTTYAKINQALSHLKLQLKRG